MSSMKDLYFELSAYRDALRLLTAEALRAMLDTETDGFRLQLINAELARR